MNDTECPVIDLPSLDYLAAQLSDDERPSLVTDDPWIGAEAPGGTGTHDFPAGEGGETSPGGKWLLYVPRERVDETWAAVRLMTRAGWLGPQAKVSTAHPNPHRTNDHHVICLYVDDWHDTTTIRRVLTNLRETGIGREWMNFKRDKDTDAGLYKRNGDHGVATFTAPPDEERLFTKRLGGVTWLDGTNDAAVVAAIDALDDLPDADDETRCGT